MTKTLAFVLTATLAACAGEAEVHYSGDAAAPELVTLDIDPSIQVVANADEPIFFVENEYYLYRDSHWYRSRSHRNGWARIETPPDRIRRIERPMAYVHFRHGTDQQRTTFNQREQVEPQRPQPMPQPIERERTQPEQLPSAPMREPNSQDPNQPYANPPPPRQVPPSPDNDPILRGQPSRPMPPDSVPSANTDRDHPYHPDHPSNPGLERSQNAPGQNRAADRAREQGDHSKRRPDPDKTKDNDKDRDSDENK